MTIRNPEDYDIADYFGNRVETLYKATKKYYWGVSGAKYSHESTAGIPSLYSIVKKTAKNVDEPLHSLLSYLFRNDPERKWGITDINDVTGTDTGDAAIRKLLMKTKPGTGESYAAFYKREYDLSYKPSIENLL